MAKNKNVNTTRFKNNKVSKTNNMRLLRNKKGYSTGFTWVFGLVTLFGLGIMYIVFSQVFNAHLVPIIKNMAIDEQLSPNIDNSTRTEIIDGIDRYMTFFNLLPFILFFIVVIYMIIAAVRKEREDEIY